MLLIILETCSESLQDEGREFWGRDTAQEQLCGRIEKTPLVYILLRGTML